MTPTESLTGVRRLLILLAVCIASITMPLNFTAAAVAVPAIGKAFNGTPLELNWVTNAFMLTFGSGLMLAGALADSYGRKRLFIFGIAAFALLALALPLAPDLFWFDLARAAQGVAAAAAFSGGMSSLAQEFDGAARVRAFSFVGSSFGIGLAFGPIASGLIIETFGWRSIFLMLTLLASLAFALGVRYLRESRNPDAAGIDWAGALSFTLALGLFTYGVLLAPEQGWSSGLVCSVLACSALCLAAFILVERQVAQPMLDLTLFRYPKFIGVQLLAAAPAYGFVVLLILLPIRFIGIEGMSEVLAGQLMIALSGPLLFLPIVAGLLTRWASPALICATGLLISSAGLFWLSQIPVGTVPGQMILPLLVVGSGISLPWGLMDGLAVSVVPKERAGMATGIFSTTRVAGEGVAVAVVTACLSAFTANSLAGMKALTTQSSISAAQHLVMGDIAGAELAFPAKGLPAMEQVLLKAGYAAGFSSLLLMLAAITAVTAAVVFVFLGRREGKGNPGVDTEQRLCEQAT